MHVLGAQGHLGERNERAVERAQFVSRSWNGDSKNLQSDSVLLEAVNLPHKLLHVFLASAQHSVAARALDLLHGLADREDRVICGEPLQDNATVLIEDAGLQLP